MNIARAIRTISETLSFDGFILDLQLGLGASAAEQDQEQAEEGGRPAAEDVPRGRLGESAGECVTHLVRH
jgi:hypothetical protein